VSTNTKTARASEGNDPNAKPCFLHGHDQLTYSDGSQLCRRCGVWWGPDPKLVNALLRANAGGRVYRIHAMQREAAARVSALPAAPKVLPPTEPAPPAFRAADGDTAPPSLWVVLPIAAAIGVALGLIAWRILGGVLL
jgi:hypothetical protein